ncbi:MAG TPA: hypothetical protein VK050_06250 [Flavobacteriaceae bacterium]|nr:hypothetical protein [Flavobacteriaceae bacterium]
MHPVWLKKKILSHKIHPLAKAPPSPPHRLSDSKGISNPAKGTERLNDSPINRVGANSTEANPINHQ